jgi:hypothetical protein
MSKFCPEWVYGICSAKTAYDFLTSNNTITLISNKFCLELNEHYNEIKREEIEFLAQKILEFLSEINASDQAAEMLNDYVYSRVNFNSDGSERKIVSMFSSALDGEKIKDYSLEKSLKIFRANTYSIRNGVIQKSTPGWEISDKEDIGWLGDLFNKEIDIFSL